MTKPTKPAHSVSMVYTQFTIERIGYPTPDHLVAIATPLLEATRQPATVSVVEVYPNRSATFSVSGVTDTHVMSVMALVKALNDIASH